MKRPDRFTRVVAADKKFEKKVFAAYRAEGWVDETLMDVILARERRAVVRLVHRLRLRARKSAFATVLAKKRPDWYDAKIEVLDDLLAAMQRRQQP